jgi:hypothetical protein
MRREGRGLLDSRREVSGEGKQAPTEVVSLTVEP